MTVYATRLANGADTRDRLRRADAAGFFPAGVGLARQGLRPDGGGVVTVSAGTMTVNVAAFTAWVDGGASDLQGGYLFVSDGSEALAVADGHASLSRTDVVIAEVRDTTHDASGSTDARVRILQGTAGAGVPALPTNAVALRNLTIPAGLSVGTGGLSAGNLSTDRRTYTTGLGGVLTVAGTAERDALAAVEGMIVYRTDVDQLEVRRGAGWVSLMTGNTADVGALVGITPASGWVPGAGTNGVVRRGNMATVYLATTRDGSSGPGAAGAAIATVPVGFRPIPTAPNGYFAGMNGADGTLIPLYITADGAIRPVFARPASTETIGMVSYVIGG